jgi:nicotinate-nucleotide--dimethylbenzimidazole phosphoribosyltransferase
MKIIKEAVGKIRPLDQVTMALVQRRLDNLTKPRGSLGRLEELAKQIAGIAKDPLPRFKRKVIFTFAADHGIAEEQISAYPKEVTAQMVFNFVRGGAGINVLARHVGAEVVVVDVGVAEKIKIQKSKIKNFKDKKINYGTKNFVHQAAMSKEEAIEAIETGIQVVREEFYKKKIDILSLGDMGIGNTTSSSAVVAAITGMEVKKVTGRGTGIDNATFNNKVKVIQKALRLHNPDSGKPLDILAKVGGFEIGAIAGAALAGASLRVPVVIDGFISSAGALLAYKFCPQIKNYLIASHRSVERGHKAILDYMGLAPILDLDLRLGEGTGAALAINIIEAGIKILDEMASFEEAGVSKSRSLE